MNEEFVGRKEFDSLKSEVNDIKKDLAESQKLLTQIDKKLDVINEKIITSDKIDDLKLAPLEKRVDKLEESQLWLRRTVIGELLTIVGAIVVYVIKVMN